jgi:hypothetical protein
MAGGYSNASEIRSGTPEGSTWSGKDSSFGKTCDVHLCSVDNAVESMSVVSMAKLGVIMNARSLPNRR